MSSLTTDQKYTESNRVGQKKELIKLPRNRKERKRDKKRKLTLRNIDS